MHRQLALAVRVVVQTVADVVVTVVLVGTTSSFTQKITILAVGFGLRPTVFLICNLYEKSFFDFSTFTAIPV